MNTRAYQMTNRAAGAEKTRQRIAAATVALVTEKWTLDLVLSDVAARAGVSLQTVLRHFGSKEALFDAAEELGKAEIVQEREAPVGDTGKALQVIIDHYEARGDWVVALLAQERSDERAKRITEPGKAIHRAWVEKVFAPLLERCSDAERPEVVDLLVVATDVYCWKLLRRDRGLSRELTERRMHRLIDAIAASIS